MGTRTVLLGLFALVFGVCAAAAVWMSNKNSQRPAVETVSVVVVTADIARGLTLTADKLTTREWPKDAVPKGALMVLADAVDRTVSTSLVKDELLLESKLAPKGAGKGMAAVIPPGMRAVTIQTPNVATGVAGFILPGNKVDVLLTMGGSGSNDTTGGGSTITLLQNVEILAVDQRIEAPTDNKVNASELRSVTLLVVPSDAAKLDLGQNKGTLRLALRNPSDKGMEEVPTATLSGLRANPNAPAPARPESEPVVAVMPVAPAPPPVDLPVPEKVSPRRRTPPPPPRQIRTLRGVQNGAVFLQSAAVRPARPQVVDADSTNSDSTK